MAERKKKEEAPEVRATVKRAPRKLDGLDQKTLKLIEGTATRVRAKIDVRTLPELKFPTRALSLLGVRGVTNRIAID
jgi:hypothetical protein